MKKLILLAATVFIGFASFAEDTTAETPTNNATPKPLFNLHQIKWIELTMKVSQFSLFQEEYTLMHITDNQPDLLIEIVQHPLHFP